MLDAPGRSSECTNTRSDQRWHEPRVIDTLGGIAQNGARGTADHDPGPAAPTSGTGLVQSQGTPQHVLCALPGATAGAMVSGPSSRGVGNCDHPDRSPTRDLRPGDSGFRLPLAPNAVALTFDDGPSNETPAFLAALRRLDVRATFFVCGRNVRRRPEVARAVVDEGHTIGNHTFSHPVLPLCSRSRIAREVVSTQEEVKAATGARPALFRPPYGLKAPGLAQILATEGLVAIGWTVIGNDWKWDSARIVRRVLRRTRPQAVICLHDGDRAHPIADRSETLQAVLEIVPALKDRGYRFVALRSKSPSGRANRRR